MWIVFGERHLRDVLRGYQQYYNGTRTHLALAKDSPLTRSVQTIGRILPLPILGGLHHRYVRIRRTAFSASSRAVDLNGETNRAKANHRSPITRSAYAIRPPPQWNEVFGTHRHFHTGH